jgi:hypothetical protein
MGAVARLLFYVARKYVESGWLGIKVERVGTQQPGEEDALVWILNRLNEPTPPTLESLVAGPPGSVGWSVATYNAPFELRKVQFIWSLSDAAVAGEDSRVATFHLAKLSGGSVTDAWVAGDFTAMDSAFSAWWTTLKTNFHANLTWDRIKVYKDGPAIEPPQVPVYDADKAVAGTSGGSQTPPQVAVSVTEIAGAKRFWGRFYLPNPTIAAFTTYGRYSSAFQTAVADASDTLYTALRAANLSPVVYRPPLPARFTKAAIRTGAEDPDLPARTGSAWDVEKVQVDDVPDVIRRRRFKYPTLRVQRDI